MIVNQKNKILFFFIIYILCFCVGMADEDLSKYKKENFKKKTIIELFDIGGKPTGWWAMQGMPWSIDELKVWSAKEVLAEAKKRLNNKPKEKYDQVFAVYCLTSIFSENEDVSQILLKAYPKVDALAQYQILHYASKYKISSFKDIFRKKIEKYSPPFTRSDLLAVIYFNTFSGEKLINSLKNLENTKLANSYILDGFPYSDVVSESVDDPLERIKSAISNIESIKVLPEDKALIKKTRKMILKSFRTNISFSDLSIIEAIDYLNSIYKDYHISTDNQIKDKKVSLHLKNATIYEALSHFCNTNGLALSNDSNGFRIYNSPFLQFSWAKNGLMVQLNIIKGIEEGPLVMLKDNLGIPWLNFSLPKVRNLNITLADESVFSCPSNSVFQIPISKEDFKSKGGIIKELSAEIQFSIPKVIKRKIISLDSTKNLDYRFCGRKLEIKITPLEEGGFEVIVKSNESNNQQSSFFQEFFDLGTIVVLDKNKNKIPVEINSFGNKKSDYSGKVVSEPKFMEWTVTTEVEVVKMPIAFKNIQLTETLWRK